MSVAYIFIALDITKSPPTVMGARIMSDRCPTTYGSGMRWMMVEEVRGATYGEAKEEARRWCETEPYLQWIAPLLGN